MGKFTEEDVKNLTQFAQFVADKAEFKLDWSEAVQLTKYQMFIRDLAKKVNDHIIELQKIIEPEEQSNKKTNKRVKK